MTILTSAIPWLPSSMTSVIAKLLTSGPKFSVAPRTRFGFVISAATGTFDHDNCGDMFSPPSQLVVLFGIIAPSLKVVDVSTKPDRRNGAGAPLATEITHHDASITPPIASRYFECLPPSMISPPANYSFRPWRARPVRAAFRYSRQARLAKFPLWPPELANESDRVQDVALDLVFQLR